MVDPLGGNVTDRLNDAPVLDQLEGQYHKILLAVLWKYLPDGAELTLRDFQQLEAEQLGDPYVLFTHGRLDSVSFKAIRRSAAQRIAKHDRATHRGRG